MPITKSAFKVSSLSIILSIVLLFILSAGTARSQDFSESLTYVNSTEATGTAADEPDMVIDSFHSDITIKSGGSVEVTETIHVTFKRRVHGTYRDLPLGVIDETGVSYNKPLKILSVTNDVGNERPYSLENRDRVLRVRLGDNFSFVKGPQVYVIRYRMENAVLFHEDRDRLIWGVTGHYWTVPIKAASARITVESDRVTSLAQATCSVGLPAYGKPDCRWENIGNTILFTANRPLEAHEGLRVVFAWDKGLIAEPSEWQRLAYGLNLGRVWVMLLVPVTFVLMLSLWFFRGRDPKPTMATSPTHTPPTVNGRPLSAAEVGAIVDESLDLKDISGTLVGLAVKEYMVIEEIRANEHNAPEDYRLMKIREPGQTLTLFEQELMRIFFPYGRMTILFSEIYPRIGTYRRRLDKVLFDEMTQKGLFPANPASVRKLYAISGGVILVFAGAASMITAPTRPAMGLLVGLIAGSIVILFSRLMARRTEDGVMAAQAAGSFREFLAGDKEIRLDWMKEETLFEYLPYAIALGVAPQWGKRFAGEFRQVPHWYRSSVDFSLLGPVKFAATASGLMTAINPGSSAVTRLLKRRSEGDYAEDSDHGGLFIG